MSLAEEERAALLKRDRRVSELYVQANLAFQTNRYDRTVELLTDRGDELDVEAGVAEQVLRAVRPGLDEPIAVARFRLSPVDPDTATQLDR